MSTPDPTDPVVSPAGEPGPGTPPRLRLDLAAWHRFVGAWVRAGRRSSTAAAALVREALAAGLPADADVPSPRPSDRQVRDCEIAVVAASGALDAAGYLAQHPQVAERGLDPVEHFCGRGVAFLDNPSADFDVWFYSFDQLGFADLVNPLVHHLLFGRFRAAATRQPVRPLLPAEPAAPGARRVCLFAAYDVDGLVDDYVVDYLRELSRHADVFYLADCPMEPGELDRLRDVTEGAWSVRHGTYDFGSYAMLADELVGWDRLDTYDELLLANDSTFLLRPLDEVFDTMAGRPCDWWGLQATKRDFETENGDDHPVPLDEATVRRLSRVDPWRQYFDLHISSYFLLLRGAAFRDPGFRRLMGLVRAQPLKSAVILKYEIGLSRVLLGGGHRFSTYVDDLYPYHPLYTSDYFELLDRGFPLLKRNFITENARRAPDLRAWRERVLARVPDAPVEVFQRNIDRVAADDKLQRSFAVTTGPDGEVHTPRELVGAELRARDARTTKHDHWWAFPVCAYDHTLAGNERAVFEEVREDPSIKKIVLTRSRRVDVTGENVVVVPLDSPEGKEHLIRARHIFVKHSPAANVSLPIARRRHTFINTWHGIPLKRFGFASLDSLGASESLAATNSQNHAVVCSSRVDRLAMTAAFHPLSYPDLWPTGLPRNDFILRDHHALPPDLAAQEDRLRDEAAGRRIVMFLPTFKSGQIGSYYRFTTPQITWLADWCDRNHAVLAVREHMADRGRTYSSMLAPLHPINLSSRRYPDLEVLYRAADALITDYSSCVVDFLLTGRPVISFAYDYDRYATEERGLFYDLQRVLPGPVCRDFDQLSTALEDLFTPRTPTQHDDYTWKRRLFFDHIDDQSSWRVVQRVKQLYVDGS